VSRAPGSIKAAFAALMLHIRIVDGSDSYDKTVRNKLADLLLKSPGKPGFKKKKKNKRRFLSLFEFRISNFEFHFQTYTPQKLKPRAAGISQHARHS
jgi:hypothetical protein